MQKLFSNVVTGIIETINAFPEIESLSIDTWGVDYMLPKGDEEFYPVYVYRNSRTEAVFTLVHEKMPFSKLYCSTGCQFQPFNTVQLFVEKLNGRMEGVIKMLMMLEYLLRKLCGIKGREYTNTIKMGVIIAQTRGFHIEIVEGLGYPKYLFPKLSQPGIVLACYALKLRSGSGNQRVVHCTTHDTGSAVAGWDMHCIYSIGKTMDATFDFIETVEKAAQIYMLITHLPRTNTIRDDQAVELVEFFGIN